MPENKSEMRAEFEKLVSGHRYTDVLCAGAELGVFELVAEKPRTAAGAAGALDCDRRGMEILLNALVSIGLLSKRKDTYGMTKLSREFLDPASKSYMGNMVRHVINLRRAWIELPAAVRTGKPIPKPDTAEKAVKERTRNFIRAMADAGRDTASRLAAGIDLEGVRRVLDVGGGPGVFLFEMIRRNPEITGDVFDSPATLEITREFIEEENMGGSVGTVEGDFTKDRLGRGYDLILMSSIVHIYSPAVNRRLIKKGYTALNPGGRLIVRDFVLDPSKTSPQQAALFSVNMLVNTDGGASYSEEEIRSWMSAAGFRKIERHDMPPRSTLITGAKPAG